jgi:hypothetical protein
MQGHRTVMLYRGKEGSFLKLLNALTDEESAAKLQVHLRRLPSNLATWAKSDPQQICAAAGEAQRRLVSNQTRTGGLLQFATELDAKPKQLRDDEDKLAAEVFTEANAARAAPAA